MIDPTLRGDSLGNLRRFRLLEPLRDRRVTSRLSQFVPMLDILRERMIERDFNSAR